MDTYFLSPDQPTTCPLCGARTDFIELEVTFPFTQIHNCLNKNCGFTFIGETDEDQLKELNLN